MSGHPTVPLAFEGLSPDESRARLTAFAARLRQRRTVRDFSAEPVARDIIEQAILAAGSAPSGANQQPWTFVAISDASVKSRIRAAAEEEEKAFYSGRAGAEWLAALSHLGTDWEKPFLETAPWLIAVFYERFAVDNAGVKHKRYYPQESVGIATGLLIAALHHAGLVTLTHTPSPMGFLNELLGRPKNEMPFLLLVVGHPAPDCRVPNIQRLALEDIASFR